MGKKILVLGLGQNNFLSFLYSKLKRQHPGFCIAAPFYTEINPESDHDSWMYENQDIRTRNGVLSYAQSFFACLFSAHVWQTFFFILLAEAKPGKAFHFVFRHIQSKGFFIENGNFEQYDVFHFHFMQYSYLRELFMVPANKKIVCTFWGSDLLRTNDLLNFYFVKKALQKSTVITCQSDELREIILSKFGRELFDKIRISIFPVNETIYDQIDLQWGQTRQIEDFKAQHSYDAEKINVLIGHNGSLANNHLKIIDALQNLRNREKIHLIINLNYAITEDQKKEYTKSLKLALDLTGCTYAILGKFFVNGELASSRLASDIFIHAPVSDALSGTMLELLYASNVVFTGSWLPYKTFRAAGLHYHEINALGELGEKLDRAVENFEAEKNRARQNKALVRKAFINEGIVNNWAEILS